MVNRGDGVEFTLEVAMKNRVAREWAADVIAFRAEACDDRPDDRLVFGAEEAAFTRVRVEAADRNPRASIPKLLTEFD
jgi:hypothetical protein